MVFQNKDLVLVCPYSERTYYRRISFLKKKKIFKKKMEGNYLTLDDALLIAENLGFRKEFEIFLKTKQEEN